MADGCVVLDHRAHVGDVVLRGRVRDPDDGQGAFALRRRAHLDADPVTLVVLERVVEQVREHALDDLTVGDDPGVVELEVDADAGPRLVVRGLRDDVADELVEAEGDRVDVPALGTGEREQRRHEVLHARLGRADPLDRPATSASGGGSTASSSVSARIRLSGVRSSCDACAAKRRWASNERSSRSSMSSNVFESSFISSLGPSRATRCPRSAADAARARSEISRAGRRTRRAMTQPTRPAASAVTPIGERGVGPRPLDLATLGTQLHIAEDVVQRPPAGEDRRVSLDLRQRLGVLAEVRLDLLARHTDLAEELLLELLVVAVDRALDGGLVDDEDDDARDEETHGEGDHDPRADLHEASPARR